MEALLFAFDSVAVILLIFTSLRNDRRGPREPQTGPFRYFEGPREAPRPGDTRRQAARRASRL